MKELFKVEFLPEATDFLDGLDDKPRTKVYYNIRKSQYVNDKELFKKLNDKIWEFRTLYNGKAYRLFAFWDKSIHINAVVIATNGYLKKTQKTPKQEIERAEEIMRQYYAQKK